MFRLLERYQTFIVVLATIFFPLLVYRAQVVSPGDANLLDRVVLAASTPLKKGLAEAIGGVSHAWYTYVDVVGARKENGELRRRLLIAERERDDLRALELENQRLRGLLLIRDANPSLVPLAATVISAGSSPLSRTVDVDVGAVQGVERGMAVVADEGLVGVVMRVGWTSSEVMLIADEKMSLWGRVVRSRARCRVRGAGFGPTFGVELTEVLRSDDVRIGDRIATSGLGGVFPAGIPIGEVRAVRTPTGSQHRVAELEPYVDFARLEHVSVLTGTVEPEQPLVTPEPLRPATLRTDISRDGEPPRALHEALASSSVLDGGVSLSAQDAGASLELSARDGGARSEVRLRTPGVGAAPGPRAGLDAGAQPAPRGASAPSSGVSGRGDGGAALDAAVRPPAPAPPAAPDEAGEVGAEPGGSSDPSGED